MIRKRMLGLLAGLALLSTGCGGWRIRVPAYTVPQATAPPSFVAGAAKREITPPAGYPMGGHSIGGKVARGYWSRLYARAFFFRDAQGHALAIVSCDLFAVPAGLHAEVARLVASEHHIALPPDALILAATHTHHGPANYMTSAVYNFGGPVPGFDPDLFRFLARQIAQTIADASEKAAAAELTLYKGFAPNIQRNRAIDAFYLNQVDGSPYQQAMRRVLDKSRAGGMTCPEGMRGDCPRYMAADPSLTVLEIKQHGLRAGLMVFFAVHPTAMSHDSTLFGSDLVGRAMTSLERVTPVAGFFNGPEGDISPRWIAQNRVDVLALGDRLAAAVQRTLASAGSAFQPAITVTRKELKVNPRGPEPEAADLSARPGFGAGQFGGAEDGRTILFTYGWHGGLRSTRPDPKLAALDLYDSALLKMLKFSMGAPADFPQVLPVTVAHLGSVFSIAAFPVEMTTVMGEYIRGQLAPVTEPNLVLVGLANEYWSYCVSPLEYAAQNYEGASTALGSQEGPAISRMLVKAAVETDVPKQVQVPEAVFEAGAVSDYHFGPTFMGRKSSMIEEGLEPLMPDAEGRLDSNAPRFQWAERPQDDAAGTPRQVAIQVERGHAWQPLLAPWTKESGDVPVAEDDTGWNILTVLVEAVKDTRSWAAIWLPPDNLRDASYRFQVIKPDGATICSRPFQLNEPHPLVPTPPLEERSCSADVVN